MRHIQPRCKVGSWASQRDLTQGPLACGTPILVTHDETHEDVVRRRASPRVITIVVRRDRSPVGMERRRPRVTRETRLLLGIVVISLAVLWALARLRFPERPTSPDPVGPVLAQFAPVSPFDAIATAVADLERTIRPSLTRVTFTPRVSDPALPAVNRIAIGITAEHAVLVLPSGERPFGSEPPVVAEAARAGLGAIRAASPPRIPFASWERTPAPSARFVIAAEGTAEGVSFRPVFVGAFMPVEDTRWPAVVWRLPGSTALADGALLFSEQGQFVGAVVLRAGERTLVPAATLALVSRAMSGRPAQVRGVVGIAVQELTPLVAEAVGAEQGVVVTWVDPKGPAAGVLRQLDVIDAVWGQALTTREQWETTIEQLEAGNGIDVRVRRAGASPIALTVIAAALPLPPSPAPFGAGLRARARIGSEVLRIEPGSAAAHAGLSVGDLITAIGAQAAPTPAQVVRAYADTADDRPLAVAVTRGAAHLVLALEKTW